ncbi:hypothetical protein PCL_05579 [Purpureocillium lilacinum]|uniref:Uncharacterized protein n=1 Tax=Purpureocillium lilacinum TaxID=33203 RepID=A0A2U3DUC2_PURLI|nr:hypothetical protein PCL_05579 [Purpureocillium lilacinum]
MLIAKCIASVQSPSRDPFRGSPSASVHCSFASRGPHRTQIRVFLRVGEGSCLRYRSGQDQDPAADRQINAWQTAPTVGFPFEDTGASWGRHWAWVAARGVVTYMVIRGTIWSNITTSGSCRHAPPTLELRAKAAYNAYRSTE